MRRIFCNRGYIVANVEKLIDWFRERKCPENECQQGKCQQGNKDATETSPLGHSKTFEKSAPGTGGTTVTLLVN